MPIYLGLRSSLWAGIYPAHGGKTMKIITMASPNYEMSDKPILAVCLHGAAALKASALAWLRNRQVANPKARVSANYFIDYDGLVYQLVNWQIGQRAWANGVVENWDRSVAWLDKIIALHHNPNWYTVSIEHEATAEQMRDRASMPDAQFNASIDLTAMILRTASLKASHETIITHSQISGTVKYNCPGVIFAPAYAEVLLDRHPDLRP